MPSLDQLQAGQRGRVQAVRASGSLEQRLLEMGLLEGELIEVIGFAPLGDPMEIRLRDYRLSLRRQEASFIIVSLDNDRELASDGGALDRFRASKGQDNITADPTRPGERLTTDPHKG